MSPTTPRRYLVLSDMHFGTADSSINEPKYRQALLAYVASHAPYEEIVFTGDLLDMNLSTLTRALEGGAWPDLKRPLFGFRQFLAALDSSMKPRGLSAVAERWVYVPGNHDYKIWDLLAARHVCEDVLARGAPMGSVHSPVMSHTWTGDASFFSGIFRSFGVQERVVVEYPNHVLALDSLGDALLTHGHYLDPSQTRGNDLAKTLAPVAPGDRPAATERIFKETAQYQSLANAVSFTNDVRKLVNQLVGPEGWGAKLQKVATTIGIWLAQLIFRRKGSLRGKDLSPSLLKNVDVYLQHFCNLPKSPTIFIFGHTHCQAKETTPSGVAVYNVGSCYPDKGRPITFLQIDLGAAVSQGIALMHVDADGAVRESL